jgi:hypothetical protein
MVKTEAALKLEFHMKPKCFWMFLVFWAVIKHINENQVQC